MKINEKEIWAGCSAHQEEIITYIQENLEKISSSSYKLNAGDKYSSIEIMFSTHDGHTTLRRLFFDKIILYAEAASIIDEIKNQTTLDITE